MTTAQDQQSRATGWAAPKDRYTMPVLFNPYTGQPRDARDIQSDPQGALIAPPGAAWQAARALPANFSVSNAENGAPPTGFGPVARIRYERNTPGRENEMPRVMSCNRMADGIYEVFTAAQVLAMGRVPPGFVAAPVEPTAEMVDAAEEAYMPFGDMALAIQSAVTAAPRPPAAHGIKEDV